MLNKNDNLNEATAEEMIRLLREIHAAVVRPPLVIKPIKLKRVTISGAIRDLMKDGKMRTVYEAWQDLKNKGFTNPESTYLSNFARFVRNGELVRIRQNLYQLAPAKD